MCGRELAIGGQSYALATALGASVYVGLRQLVVRGFDIPLLARIAVSFSATVAQRIYVYFDDASDTFLATWPKDPVRVRRRGAAEPPPLQGDLLGS